MARHLRIELAGVRYPITSRGDGPEAIDEDMEKHILEVWRQPIDVSDEALVKLMPARVPVAGDTLSVPLVPRQPPAGRSHRDCGPPWREQGGQGGGLGYRCRHWPTDRRVFWGALGDGRLYRARYNVTMREQIPETLQPATLESAAPDLWL